MRTPVRAFAAGAVAVCLTTLIIASWIASIPEPSLEGVMFLPLMFGLAVVGAALFAPSLRDCVAFCAGSVAAAVVIVVAWSRLHTDAPDLVIWFVGMPTALGAALGCGARVWFTRGRRSWEAFRDEARGY